MTPPGAPAGRCGRPRCAPGRPGGRTRVAGAGEGLVRVLGGGDAAADGEHGVLDGPGLEQGAPDVVPPPGPPGRRPPGRRSGPAGAARGPAPGKRRSLQLSRPRVQSAQPHRRVAVAGLPEVELAVGAEQVDLVVAGLLFAALPYGQPVAPVLGEGTEQERRVRAIPRKGAEAGADRGRVRQAPVAVQEALGEHAQVGARRRGAAALLLHAGQVGGHVQAHETGQMQFHHPLHSPLHWTTKRPSARCQGRLPRVMNGLVRSVLMVVTWPGAA